MAEPGLPDERQALLVKDERTAEKDERTKEKKTRDGSIRYRTSNLSGHYNHFKNEKNCVFFTDITPTFLVQI